MAFLSYIADLLGAGYYSQHSICLSNDPVIMIVYIASDITTSLSYWIIGVTLILNRKFFIKLDGGSLILWGSFIVLCGLTHFTMTVTLFYGVYRLDVAVRAATAAVSAVTAASVLLDTLNARMARNAGRTA